MYFDIDVVDHIDDNDKIYKGNITFMLIDKYLNAYNNNPNCVIYGSSMYVPSSETKILNYNYVIDNTFIHKFGYIGKNRCKNFINLYLMYIEDFIQISKPIAHNTHKSFKIYDIYNYIVMLTKQKMLTLSIAMHNKKYRLPPELYQMIFSTFLLLK